MSSNSPVLKTDQSQDGRQRYTVLRNIDSGGMAEIYLGQAESIEGITRSVAIKRVHPHLVQNEKFITMFLDEARLSMLLTHANIVQVFDVGRSGDTYFIVMEYVDGYNLRRVFQKASELGYRIPLEIACYILMEVCEGLAHAHEKTDGEQRHLHIVHRDLSPPNIMVSKAGETKITDFGLAKAMTQLNTTDPGVVKGKFSYLAPETADGRTIDHRVDIFAAGIVLWEILANRRLFLGQSDLDTVELVKRAEVPALSKINSDVTQEFDQVIMRALARDPAKRYTSAREMGEALANFVFKHNLRVTKSDVAGMVSRLFSEGASLESQAERIETLIQEEILSLSMLGNAPSGPYVDGSRPMDPNSVPQSTPPLTALSYVWGASLESTAAARPSQGSSGALELPPVPQNTSRRQALWLSLFITLAVCVAVVLVMVLGGG